ncbi:calcineurin-like phosphoesterase [Daldinia decipiens]|uniref:calcineurin-like phosphoesterase n=1 Tax=Daldinia decipiens TaxID=326647 RepID=UPI0020C42AE5|nr:calcineurin-like phosphoesterase [Daldinia decipiens]KAI1653018.1 calcineurin-like phosphoesterase [Daldinia decipiens]
MVTIQILSDLHLEAYDTYEVFEITPHAPYLALLGDISCAKKHEEHFLAFLRRQLANFRVVFFLLVLQGREMQSYIGEFIFLNKRRYDINDNGTNLTILDDVSFGLNDFYHIENWTVEQHSAEHDGELAWLNNRVEELQDSGRKVVIFTHHSPTRDERSVEAQHRQSKRIAGLSTDLSDQQCWRSNDVKLWAFGHTHYNCDYVDAKTNKRVYTNQKGYFGGSDGFDVNRVICL